MSQPTIIKARIWGVYGRPLRTGEEVGSDCRVEVTVEVPVGQLFTWRFEGVYDARGLSPDQSKAAIVDLAMAEDELIGQLDRAALISAAETLRGDPPA